jgi:hypothetical protein
MDMAKMLAEEKEDMLRHKYIESEKAGRDLGEPSMVKWAKEYGEAWRFNYNKTHMMDLGDGTKPVYFGIFLDQKSREYLQNELFEYVPSGWRMLCHHCTIAFGSPEKHPDVLDFLALKLAKNVELEIVSLGISDDAIAVGVAGDFKSINPIPHITVGIPFDGKPKNSNFIKDWNEFKMDRKVVGVVDAYPSHFGWKH